MNSMRDADEDTIDAAGRPQKTRGGRSLSSGVVGACHALRIAHESPIPADFGSIAQRILIAEGEEEGTVVSGCAPPLPPLSG